MNDLDIKMHKDASSEVKKLAEKINEDVEKKGGYEFFLGVYGDGKDCTGIIEDTIYPEEGGILTKLYGCSFLYKGRPMNHTLESISLGKAMVSHIPRTIITKSWLLMGTLGLMFVFARKRFIHYLARYTDVLYQNIANKNFKKEWYNTMVRELRRTMNKILVDNYDNARIGEDSELVFYKEGQLPRKEMEKIRKSDMGELIKNVSEFVFFFIEYDNAYRFRLQDIFEEINKENVKKDVVAEIERLFQILKRREHYMLDGEQKNGIWFKWKKIKKILIPFLRISKKARELVKDFLLELNIDKVALDEHDWYFCLDRKYEFKDMTRDERMKEKEKLDKQRGHIPVIVSNDEAKDYQSINKT